MCLRLDEFGSDSDGFGSLWFTLIHFRFSLGHFRRTWGGFRSPGMVWASLPSKPIIREATLTSSLLCSPCRHSWRLCKTLGIYMHACSKVSKLKKRRLRRRIFCRGCAGETCIWRCSPHTVVRRVPYAGFRSQTGPHTQNDLNVPKVVPKLIQTRQNSFDAFG